MAAIERTLGEDEPQGAGQRDTLVALRGDGSRQALIEGAAQPMIGIICSTKLRNPQRGTSSVEHASSNTQLYLKRTLDVSASSVMIVILSPLMLLLYLLILGGTGINPLFVQIRIGHRMQPFRILKFRTLLHGTSKNCGGQHYCFLGHALRRTGLDELPQLFNVLFGSMSLVGPRPLIPAESERMRILCPERFSIRPGMTGLAQISGRRLLADEEKAALDALYVRQISIYRDIEIILKTVMVITSSQAVEY